MNGRRWLISLVVAMLAERLAADSIDDYLRREMAARKIPGLALAVARDGVVVRTSEYGLANVETSAPVSRDALFAIASLDKQITAAAMVKAAELGRLDLGDPVSRWVEIDLPGATLRQLVSHLSGLPDDTVPSYGGRFLTDYSTEELLRHAQGLVPVAPPGTRFLYSDTGLLLAQVATERAVKEPWWTFVERELFAPAGVRSAVSMRPAALLPHRVSAYTLSSAGDLVRDRRLDTDYGPLYSDLGMTAADFARFLAAQDDERSLSRSGILSLTTPSRLANGWPVGEVFQWSRYGLGVGIDSFAGETVTLHSGHSGVGFARFPARGLSVVVFTNLEHPAGSDPVGLALGVAGLLETALDLAKQPAAAVRPEELATLRADYEAFLSGKPALDRFVDGLSLAAWEGAPGLAGRAQRLEALEEFEVLDDTPLEGARTRLCRARHVHGTIYWRVSFEAASGRISRLVWWHI